MSQIDYRPRKPIPIRAHEGKPEQQLARYRRDLHQAFDRGTEAIAQLCCQLPTIITQPENLYVAYQHLLRYGGEAAGPDGIKLQDLGRSDVWEIFRQYSAQLRSGQYSPAPPKIVNKPKGGDRGLRTIEVANAIDRVVARAAAQIVGPWLEYGYHPSSFGFRRERSHLDALATALQQAEAEDRWHWLTADVRDAFGSVPIRRLLDVVGAQFGSEVTQLLGQIIGPRRTGLSQGSPLSPDLLNAYLTKFCDEPWSRREPSVPLYRYADDLLALCNSAAEAQQADESLTSMLLPAAMKIKDDDSKAIVYVRQQPARWLGFSLARATSSWQITIGESGWDHLSAKLWSAQEGPDSVRCCRDTLQGWLTAMGPAYDATHVQPMVAQIHEIATQCGFTEPPSRRQLREWWRTGNQRWQKVVSQMGNPSSSEA